MSTQACVATCASIQEIVCSSMQQVFLKKIRPFFVLKEKSRPSEHPPVRGLLFAFSVLVANPKKLLYTVANPARGLLNREQRTKEKGWQRPPPPPRCSFGEKYKNHVTHLQALRRSRSVSRPSKDLFDSSTRSKGVASQNSTLPCAITTSPVSLPLSSPGDV